MLHEAVAVQCLVSVVAAVALAVADPGVGDTAAVAALEAGRLLLAGEALGAGGGGDQPQRQQQQDIQHDGLIHSLGNKLWKMVSRPGLYIP